mgnify:CR=1 FL=1
MARWWRHDEWRLARTALPAARLMRLALAPLLVAVAPLAVPALSGKVIVRGTYGDDSANFASTTTIADTNTYNLRSSDLIQSVKGEVKFGAIKLFTTVEGARRGAAASSAPTAVGQIAPHACREEKRESGRRRAHTRSKQAHRR